MSIVPLENSVYHQRMGRLEYSDMGMTSLACIAAFCRWSGRQAKVDAILSIAPVPQAGPSQDLLAYIARRAGVRLNALSPTDIPSSVLNGPVLLVRTSGYALIILGKAQGCFEAGLPGHPSSFCRIPCESDILDDVAAAYALTGLPSAAGLIRFNRSVRFFLIPWSPAYAGRYDADAVASFNREFSAHSRPQSDPAPLSDLTWQVLLQSHRSMCPSLPQYFGVYRRINLKRNAVFVNSKAIAQATRDLLRLASRSVPADHDELLLFGARLFVDFLSIHPFFDGNRRMGMTVVSRYFHSHGWAIEWRTISRSQCYYWVRCASKGHFISLVEGLRSAVHRPGRS